MSTDIIDKLEADLMATRERGKVTLSLIDKVNVNQEARDMYRSVVDIQIKVIDMGLEQLPQLRESFMALHEALAASDRAFASVEKLADRDGAMRM